MEISGSVPPAADVTAAQPAPGAEEQKPNLPPEGEAPPETQEETTEQQEAKRQSKFQRRLDRQKTARIEAETRAKIAEERLAKLEAQSKPQQGSDEPKEADFQDYTQYTRALAKWEAQQVLKADREESAKAREGKEKQQQANAGTEKVAKAWAERESSFQAANKDYIEVVTPFADEELQTLSKDARMAIVESDVGPALLHHLAKLANDDPAAFERIADMSPVRQIAELGKLETKLTMPAKRTTNAPAPASPVGARASGQKDPGKMTDSEYKAWRKSQGARWAQ